MLNLDEILLGQFHQKATLRTQAYFHRFTASTVLAIRLCIGSIHNRELSCKLQKHVKDRLIPAFYVS